MSGAIILESPDDKTPGEIKSHGFAGIFGEVEGGTRGPSLETLTRNKQLSVRIASWLMEDRPDWADRLLECHQHIQHGQGGWLTSKYCRLTRYCLNCQAVRGGLVQQQYTAAVLDFQRQYDVRLQLQSMVLHFAAAQSDLLSPEESLHAFAPVISAFHLRLAKYRHKHNAKVMKAARPRRADLIGPTLCVPHILPVRAGRSRGRRVKYPISAHLHLLAANHPRRPKRAFAELIETLWLTSANESPVFVTPSSVVVKLEDSGTEDARHTANKIAYIGRTVKAGWDAGQVVSIARHIERSGELGTVYISGGSEEKKRMPNSFVLTGETLSFDREELKYVPTT
jgi:hypothetical protein